MASGRHLCERCLYHIAAFPLHSSEQSSATRTIIPKLQGIPAKQGTALVDAQGKVQVNNCIHRVNCSPHLSPQQPYRDHRLPDLEAWLESPVNLLPEKVP